MAEAGRRAAAHWENGPPILLRQAYGGQAKRRPYIQLHRSDLVFRPAMERRLEPFFRRLDDTCRESSLEVLQPAFAGAAAGLDALEYFADQVD